MINEGFQQFGLCAIVLQGSTLFRVYVPLIVPIEPTVVSYISASKHIANEMCREKHMSELTLTGALEQYITIKTIRQQSPKPSGNNHQNHQVTTIKKLFDR